MANSDKDILITPNSGSSSADPKIEYVGANSSGNDTITVETLYDGTKATLSFEGSAGQLFSVVNDLSSDPIFSVNDVSGIPSIEVDSDGEIRLAEFNGKVGIRNASPQANLHIGPLTGGNGTAQERLRISGDYTATGSGSFIRFTNQHNSGTNPNSGEYNIAGIKAFDFRSDWGGALALQTAPNTSTGGNLTDRLVINPEGDVGINTSNPASFLHVHGTQSYGTLRISPTSTNGESAMAFFLDTNATTTSTAWVVGHAGWGNTGDFVIGNQAYGGPVILVQQNGNVGIGTTSPGSLLDVDGRITANNLTLQNLSGQSSEATAVMIDGSGIIGTRELGSNAFNSTTIPSLSGYATESYVTTQINNLIDSAPGALNTLNELAAAINDDASFSTTVTNSIATKLPLAGGTMTGDITMNGNDMLGASKITLNMNPVGTSYGGTSSATPANMISQVVGSNDGWRLYGEGASNDVQMIFEIVDDLETGDTWIFRNKKTYSDYSTRNEFIITGEGTFKSRGVGYVETSQRVFADNYHPNADKWTTARTITLGGDLTGNVSIDGSANVTLTAAVVDDSHNHVISNVDGLQTALDAKLTSSSGLNASNLTSGTVPDARIAASSITQHTDPKYLRSNADDTVTAGTTYTWSATDTQGLVFENSSYNKKLYIGGWSSANSSGISRIRNSNDNLHLDSGSAGNLYLNHYSGGNVYARQNLIWHAGNDGSGSGLDADTLDGYQATALPYTPINDFNSLGTTAFTAGGGSNSTMTTAQYISEMEGDGAFDSFSSVFKTTWSYAGNDNISDAGSFGPTETAGMSHLTWTDNSSDSTRGNITVLAIAPNTGGSAGGVYVYNDQGSGYAPGWREIWTSSTDGAGSGLDADLLDGQHGSHYLNYNNFTNTPTIPTNNNQLTNGAGYLTASSTQSKYIRSDANDSSTGVLTLQPSANRTLILDRNIASPSNYYNDLQMEVRATSGTAGIGLHRNGYSHVGIYHNTQNRLDIDFNSGDVIINHNAGTLWGSGNDGSGSGLDADTVDGIQGASLLRSDANDTFTGTLTLNGQLDLSSTDTAANYIHMPRGGGITFYGDTSQHHGIFSRDQSNGTGADDLLITSYGAVYIDLDSNSNNSSAADFVIGRHNSTSQNLFKINGETAHATLGHDGQNPNFKLIYDDNHANGDRWDTIIELGRLQDRHNGSGNYPTYQTANGYGLYMQGNSDGCFFGMEQYSTTNFRPVIAWGDDASDNPFFIRYNNTAEFAFTYNGVFHADDDIIAFSTTTSDARYKDNVSTIENALDKVQKLRGVEFDWNATSRKGEHDIGFIAQEIEQVIPEVVSEQEMLVGDFEGKDEKAKTVAYGQVTALLVEAIKEQQEIIDKLIRRINDIEKGE